MATYIIGDLQGCYASFMALLARLKFDTAKDKVWLAGDLVNRGHDSLATLRFIYQHQDCINAILGNHDLHLLSAYYQHKAIKHEDTFLNIILAPDAACLIEWLTDRPLSVYFDQFNLFLSHAGLYPQWSCKTAIQLGEEIQQQLASKNTLDAFFAEMYGNKPNKWDDDLTGADRYRFVINALTRMRFLTPNLELNLNYKGNIPQAPDKLFPWFNHAHALAGDTHIAFGHWASLEGEIKQHTNGDMSLFPLDTGCVWGGSLTALHLEKMQLISIDSNS